MGKLLMEMQRKAKGEVDARMLQRLLFSSLYTIV